MAYRVLLSCLLIATQIVSEVKAQTMKGYGQRCAITYTGQKPVTFSCRWMYDGTTGATIFVDNNETWDRYIVDGDDSSWRMDFNNQNCIVKKMTGAKVCRIKK